MKSNRTSEISLTLLAVLGVGLATCLPTTAATLYSVTDLGNLGGSNFLNVTGINNLGQVVGNSSITNNTSQDFRTAPNSPINPVTDGLGQFSSAADINDLGQVASGNGGSNVFRTAPNSPINAATDLLIQVGNNANVTPTGINNLGQVVLNFATRGTAMIGPRPSDVGTVLSIRAFRTAPNSEVNQLTDIGSLGGVALVNGVTLFANSSAINDLGQVVGSSRNTSLEVHAYRTAANSPINSETDDLGTLGGSSSIGIDINNLGQVVGNSTTASGESHAFRTAANSSINPATDDLGTLGGSISSASAINILGQVVGDSITASGQRRAFLYDDDQLFDLNDLIPADLGIILNYAADINDSGQIVAGTRIRDLAPDNRIFLLTPIVSTPVPESSGEQMLDLNDLIPADLGVILNYAADINDRGQIAAGTRITDLAPANRIFLSTPIVSTPVPEPSAGLGILAFGAMGATMLRASLKSTSRKRLLIANR